MADDLWSQRIQTHRVIALLDEVLTLVKGTASDPKVTPSSAAYLRRAEAVISRFKSRLSRTDARFVSQTALENAASYLDQVKGETQNFVANGNEGHLGNADGKIDNLADAIYMLPTLTPRDASQATAEEARSQADGLQDFESTARQRLADLAKQIEDSSGSLSALSQKLDETQQTAQNTANEIIADRDARIAELRAEIDSQKGRLDEAISNMQNNFTQSQAQSLDTFNRSEQERQSTFTQKTDALLSQQEARLKEVGDKVTASLEKLGQYERDAARIVGISAAAEVAGGYDTEASLQKKDADVWRIVAFAVGSVLIVGSVVVAILGVANESTSEILTFALPKLAVGGALAGVFGYAANESAKHRDRERRAKQRALELASFRPFLVELPENEQHEAIKNAVNRYYKGDDGPPDREAKAQG